MTTATQTSRPALGPGWSTLSRALVALLGLALLGNLLNGAFSFWAWRTFRGWVDEPAAVDLGQATAYDTGTAVAALVLTVVHLTVLVLMITWLYQAHRSDRMDPSRLEHKSGWAIGGWFVPFLNLVRPYQVVEDVRVASQSSLGRQSDVVLAWWLTVVGASIAGRVTAALVSGAGASDSETISAIASANLSDVVGSVLWVAAAVLGILVVRSTTRLVEQSPHVPVSAAA